MSETLDALVSAGHFSYIHFEITFSSRAEIKELQEKELFFRSELDNWNKTVKEMRLTYYYLNFFSIERIIYLIENLKNGMRILENLFCLFQQSTFEFEFKFLTCVVTYVNLY
jgi:hypothetical protein